MPLAIHSSRRAGMALVVVLAIQVLITVAVLVFFSHATADRQVENQRASRAVAELMAESAGDYVVSQFVSEITGTVQSDVSIVNGVNIYTPKSGKYMVPQRNVSAALASDNNAMTLVRQSIPAADANASTHNSADPAKNRRLFTADRWNQPRLVGGGGFSSTGQLPHWIYMDRSQAAAASGTTSTIGRFAYNVYEVGGLLNVNTAGYINGASGMTATQAVELKRSPLGADLRCLGISEEAISELVSFRNPKTGGTDYIPAAKAAIEDGFINNILSSGTNNYFATRQDLLRYASKKNPGLVTALPYLTHFSRTVNTPSWRPHNPATADAGTSTIDYEANADANATFNRNFLKVRFSGTASIDHYTDEGKCETYSVKAGDPLLQRRFSLARLAWLTPKGPSAKLDLSDPQYNAGGSYEAIQACFGLVWVEDQGRWEYVGNSGTTTQTAIKTLATVLAENREPNFFELLRAGIMEGSLGQVGSTSRHLGGSLNNKSVQPQYEISKDLQVIKIGANIIDCADADNYPTIIYFKPGGAGIETAGEENLPYFHGLDRAFLSKLSTAADKSTILSQSDTIYTPIFFNPHSGNAATTGGPSTVEATVVRGGVTFAGMFYFGTWASLPGSLVYPDPPLDLTGQTISISASDFTSRPNAARSTSLGPQSLKTLVPYSTNSSQDTVETFRIFSYQNDAPGTMPMTVTSAGYQFAVNLSNFLVALQYVTPGGKTKIYATPFGYDDGTRNGPDMGQGGSPLPTGYQTSVVTTCYDNLFDPRTIRLGPSEGQSANSAFADPFDPMASSYVVFFGDPFNWNNGNLGEGYIRWGRWPEGDRVHSGYQGVGKKQDYYINMRDPDGITRPADCWLDQSSNPYRDLADPSRRPVILQRPFRNVAELGCVLRDQPWKTLNFFDETSADGALLDLFSVTDEPVITAGRVNLNTAPAPVLASLLSGAAETDDLAHRIDASTANEVGTAFFEFTRNDGVPNSNMPGSPGSLPLFMSSANIGGIGLSPMKSRREAVVRALSDATQARTWNLLIDVVAQSGRFTGPAGASAYSASDFVVEGESRRWIAIAIDRYTGKIIDLQQEVVSE